MSILKSLRPAALTLCFAIFLLCNADAVFAQVSIEQVQNALKSYERPNVQALLLRNFYSGKELRFSEGGEVSSPHPGSWTADGWIRVEKAVIQKGMVEFRGRRLIVVFPDQKMRLADGGKRKVVIVMPVPRDEAALQNLMSTVFFRPDESFTSSLPTLWQEYLRHLGKPPAEKSDRGQQNRPPVTNDIDGFQIHTVGKGVSPPEALFAPDPPYDPAAQSAKLQGTVVLWCIVQSNGKADKIRIQRALGGGLDEKAIETVQSWRFKPAQYQGNAVAVQINIEVNFRIY